MKHAVAALHKIFILSRYLKSKSEILSLLTWFTIPLDDVSLFSALVCLYIFVKKKYNTKKRKRKKVSKIKKPDSSRFAHKCATDITEEPQNVQQVAPAVLRH